VNTADIDREGSVDEYPNVVIASELEAFATLVLEPIPQFTGKSEVVI